MSVKKFMSIDEFKGGPKEQLTPMSTEALKRQGFTIDELRFVSFKELKKQSDARGVPNEILKLRWTHFEEKRVEKILICRQERKRIIEEGGMFESSTHHVNIEAPMSSSMHSRVMSAKPK